MTPVNPAAVVGTCHCCQLPVRAGEERQVGIDQATGASPMVLLHLAMCWPPRTRRYLTPDRRRY